MYGPFDIHPPSQYFLDYRLQFIIEVKTRYTPAASTVAICLLGTPAACLARGISSGSPHARVGIRGLEAQEPVVMREVHVGR